MTSYREPRPEGTARKKQRRVNSSRARLLTSDAGRIQTTLEVAGEEGEDYVREHDDLPALVLMMSKTVGVDARHKFGFELTAFTETELHCLRDAIDAAIEVALPIARAHDERVRHAHDNPTEHTRPNSRLYRAVPYIRLGDGSSVVYDSNLPAQSHGPITLVWPPGTAPFRDGNADHEVADGRVEVGPEPGDHPPAA